MEKKDYSAPELDIIGFEDSDVGINGLSNGGDNLQHF